MNVAIIGGADGPTAIFVASRFAWVWYAGLAVVLAAVVIVTVLLIRKHKKKQS